MTTIKATCPTCGEVGLTPDDMGLYVAAQPDGDSYYRFACPSCHETVQKPADSRIVSLLRSGGVPVFEQLALSPRPEGPPFTYDDLLDFHFLLEGDAWMQELLTSV